MDVNNVKPKHRVLQEFADVLLRRNPMNLKQDNPLEYETEALSILSRFTEAALQLSDDETIVDEIAVNVVKQALDFWFDNVDSINCEPLARELLGVFRASFKEGVAHISDVKPVTSITIGE